MRCRAARRRAPHRADDEAEIILVEPAGVVNTGNVVDAEFTAPTGVAV